MSTKGLTWREFTALMSVFSNDGIDDDTTVDQVIEPFLSNTDPVEVLRLEIKRATDQALHILGDFDDGRVVPWRGGDDPVQVLARLRLRVDIAAALVEHIKATRQSGDVPFIDPAVDRARKVLAIGDVVWMKVPECEGVVTGTIVDRGESRYLVSYTVEGVSYESPSIRETLVYTGQQRAVREQFPPPLIDAARQTQLDGF